MLTVEEEYKWEVNSKGRGKERREEERRDERRAEPRERSQQNRLTERTEAMLNCITGKTWILFCWDKPKLGTARVSGTTPLQAMAMNLFGSQLCEVSLLSLELKYWVLTSQLFSCAVLQLLFGRSEPLSLYCAASAWPERPTPDPRSVCTPAAQN